jgi:hypothetical protein
MMKNALLIFLVIFGVLLVPISAFAEDSVILNKNEIEKKLFELGFPEEYIKMMELEQMQEIINSNPVQFSGGEKVDYFFDEKGELQELNPGTISLMGTIPRADLTLYNGKTYLGTFNGRKTYAIYVNWQWHKRPVFQYVDKVGLSYNDQFQTRVSNNGAYSCRSYTKKRDGSTASSTNCYGRPSEISYGGAAWNYNHDKNDYNNSGWAQMHIETKSTKNSSGTGIVLSKYFHKTGFPGSLGVSIKYVSIGINSGSSYNTASAQHSWYY